MMLINRISGFVLQTALAIPASSPKDPASPTGHRIVEARSKLKRENSKEANYSQKHTSLDFGLTSILMAKKI